MEGTTRENGKKRKTAIVTATFPAYMLRAMRQFQQDETVIGTTETMRLLVYEALKNRRGQVYEELAQVFEAEKLAESAAGQGCVQGLTRKQSRRRLIAR